jgi:CheY-like chemotaxis protein
VSDTVFVGDRPPPAAQACLPRPVDPRQIERALDALVRTRPGTVAAPVLPPPTPTATAAASTDVDLLLFDLDVTAAHPLAGRTGGGGGRPVLVVDDSRIARKFLAQRLARLGYRVEVAASAEEALNKLADQAFAIVFADIVLGEDSSADGLALCRQIKESAGADAPRVVLVSGHAASNDRVRSSLAGCDAFIAKPIAEQELLRALRAADAVFAQA